MASPNEKIRQIRELIKNGKRKQAVSMLTTMIEKDHDNPELWWLLANAAQDPHQVRMALDELLALRPDDERAQKLLDRIETRQLLNQMGFKREEKRLSNTRGWIYGGVTAIVVLVVLVVALIAVSNRDNNDDVAQALPTSFNFPTETDVPPTDEPTTEPTTAPVEPLPTSPELSAPLGDAPQGDTPQDAAPQSDTPESTEEAAPSTVTDSAADSEDQDTASDGASVPNIDFSVEPDPEGTLEVLPPINPDTATLIVPTVQSLGERLDDVRNESTDSITPVTPDPESTAEVSAPNTNTPLLGSTITAGGALTGGTPAIAPTSTPKPVIARGQLIEREPRQEIIAPYGEHGWTFSGYRDEQITIELVNITGRGNPSLELRNARDEVVSSDIDVTSGSNSDATISLTLPSDGIYTVVVRMAAVDEQLYYLLLTRG